MDYFGKQQKVGGLHINPAGLHHIRVVWSDICISKGQGNQSMSEK
jgi:hypothetical protein